jgi:hypothetical protein
MRITDACPAVRAAEHYTTRHRHHLPGGGYTDWSEGIPNDRHSHGVPEAEGFGQVAASVGSPVHRHAWSVHRRRRKEQGYTSGPMLARSFLPAIGWLQRVLARPARSADQ